MNKKSRPLRDAFRLLLGHFTRYRTADLQDIATRGLKKPRVYQNFTLFLLNATTALRRWWTKRVVLYLRFLRSRLTFRQDQKHHGLCFSLLCPTRGRVNNVASFLNSILRSACRPDRIEILFYIDTDDPTLPEYQAFFQNNRTRLARFKRCLPVIGEPIGVPRAWNLLAEQCSGDFLMMANDDQFYVDYAWDVCLEKEALKFPDRVVCLYLDDGQYPEGSCDFPIIGRTWYETVGYFVPDRFEFWETETWVLDIAHRIDRLHSVPGIFVEHFHFQAYKAPFDVTYQRHRLTRDKSYADHQLFLKSADDRERDAQKLKQVITSFGKQTPQPNGHLTA